MTATSTKPTHELSIEDRLTRLEHGLAAVALRLTSNYPLRGTSGGNDAVQQITLEYEAVERDRLLAAERVGLEAKLAELGEAA